ncbi:hypothetical protein HDU81_002632 [Chytriomyces hyalinus]|nr:hypothetical protein HDU81_002632 [Chytriomyces hyalinus]
MRSSVRVKNLGKESEELVQKRIDAENERQRDKMYVAVNAEREDEPSAPSAVATPPDEIATSAFTASDSASNVPTETLEAPQHEPYASTKVPAHTASRMSRSSSALLLPLDHKSAPPASDSALPPISSTALPTVASSTDILDSQFMHILNSVSSRIDGSYGNVKARDRRNDVHEDAELDLATRSAFNTISKGGMFSDFALSELEFLSDDRLDDLIKNLTLSMDIDISSSDEDVEYQDSGVKHLKSRGDSSEFHPLSASTFISTRGVNNSNIPAASLKQSMSFESLSSIDSHQTAVVSMDEGMLDAAKPKTLACPQTKMTALYGEEPSLGQGDDVSASTTTPDSGKHSDMYINPRPHRGTGHSSNTSTGTSTPVKNVENFRTPVRLSKSVAAVTEESSISICNSFTEPTQQKLQNKGTSTSTGTSPPGAGGPASGASKVESDSYKSMPEILSRTGSGGWNPSQNISNPVAAHLADVGGASSITLYENDSPDEDERSRGSSDFTSVQGSSAGHTDRIISGESSAVIETPSAGEGCKKKKKSKSKASKKSKKNKKKNAGAALLTSDGKEGSLLVSQSQAQANIEEVRFVTTARQENMNSDLASKMSAPGKSDSFPARVFEPLRKETIQTVAMDSSDAMIDLTFAQHDEPKVVSEMKGRQTAEKLCRTVPEEKQGTFTDSPSKAIGSGEMMGTSTATKVKPRRSTSIRSKQREHAQLQTNPESRTNSERTSASSIAGVKISSLPQVMCREAVARVAPEVPQWQKLVFSSSISSAHYADLIDEVVRTLGYKLVSISRKPDSYPYAMPFGHSRRNSGGHDTSSTAPAPPCTKGSLHLLLQRTTNSVPLTAELGLHQLYTHTKRQMHVGSGSRTNSSRSNSDAGSVKDRQEQESTLFTVSREQDPHSSGIFASDLRSQGKSLARIQRAELFGCYIGGRDINGQAALPPGGVQIPQVICVLAKGGFGVPVMRALLKKQEGGLEFLGLRYVKALLPFQARIVTPFDVCDPKWAASCRFLSAGCGSVYGDAVAKDHIFQGHESEAKTDENQSDSDEGYMVIVLRKVEAFQEVDSYLSSFIDSYSSLVSPVLDASDLMHDSSALTAADKLQLSLLVSWNPEMAYATLTAFFRDSDLIPERWVGPSSGSSAHITGLTSPDDPEVTSNPSAIPLSLINPPRGHYALILFRGSSTRCLGSLLNALVIDGGLVLSSVRFMSLAGGNAGKLDNVDPDLVTRWDADESEGGTHDEECIGVGLSGLLKWASSGPLCMLVVWGVAATRRVHDIMSAFSVRGGITRPTSKVAGLLSRGDALLSQDFYVPNNYGVGQYQISILCPKGFPIEVREFPRQLGTFQRKLVTRRLSASPLHDKRLQSSGVLPFPPASTLSTLILSSVYPTVEANMVEWTRIFTAIMQITGSQFTPPDGGQYQKYGAGNNKTGLGVVGMSYFVPTEGLAAQISECIGGAEAFSVINLLNGPCFAVVFEGGGEVEDCLLTAASQVSSRIKSQVDLFAVLNHEESQALIPLVITELAATSAYRLGFSNPPPNVPASHPSKELV